MNKTLTPLKAIRQHCLVCAGRPKDVRECPSTECSLHAYRMGHNPPERELALVKSMPGRFPRAFYPTQGEFPRRSC